MTDPKTFDFWYAVNNTEVVLMPSGRLETFGSTVLHYHLVSELMDTVNQVRVREGRLKAGQPAIVTPEAYSRIVLEGFGEEASNYIDWLKEHEKEIRVLQYGYTLRRESFSEHIISDNLKSVVERVKAEVKERNDPLSAVLVGVDLPWDVCLIKLFREVIQRSAPHNVRELQKRRLFDDQDGLPRGVREQIDADFLHASRDSTFIKALAHKLQQMGVFEEYQDRFFSLVKASKRQG
jgi:hypothetical protein